MADSKARAAGPVYRDEAADLMAAAARRATSRPPPPELDLQARRAAPDIRMESGRPLPYPDPIGINDNVDDYPAPRLQRRRLSFLQIAARVLIAPWYAAVAVASVAFIVLFGRGLFGV